MRRLTVVIVTAVIAASCGSFGSGAATSAPADPSDGQVVSEVGGVPRCDQLVHSSAPASWYRDSPIYVANEMPLEAVRAWAETKPGFEAIWIDREHLGWITVAFSAGVEARQRELQRAFPDVGAVVVPVGWTMAGLESLQRRVIDELGPLFPSFSSGIYPTEGVVGIGVGVLTQERIDAIDERFAGERVCISGIDPATAPVAGPQPSGGEGWRLLADEEGAGEAYRTGIATDARSYVRLWDQVALSGGAPTVDFTTEVVIWFGAVFGSSCPNIRLDDVVVDRDRALVYAKIVLVDPPAACTADANPHAYLVSVDRSMLPVGRFAIQLDADGPPPGAPEERTIVDADLSQPGAVAGDDQVGPDRNLPEPFILESGGIIEPAIETPYRLDTRCGVAWLGRLNDVSWHTDSPEAADGAIPEAWQDTVDDTGFIDVSVVLRIVPEPAITARMNGYGVTYTPTAKTAPICP
ncbi:hypothetical protein BMS3Bbin01_02956 [bacterium BMS3Bbin01]|nr:hypothetical protein BMS3Bbin01_02956 [bacterium BMS3Bbin01]